MRLSLRRDKEKDEEWQAYSERKKEFFKEKKTKKKRGEIKPWTRRERYFVLGVFLATVVISAILGMGAREWKLPNLPRLTLPKILSEETIVIEGNPKDVKEAEIIKKFNETTDPLSGVYGFFVIDLSNGNFFGVNERETFEAASLNKLPVMLSMYKAAEEGSLNLSSVYVLKEEDKMEGSGSLAAKPAGTKLTYEEIVRLMGKESDNTAFNIAKKVLGEQKVLKTMRAINLPDSLLLENEITPYDIGFFWKNLWEEKYMSRETKDALLAFMTNTIYEDWMAKEIPVPVAHKFGRLEHVRNDAGIIMSQEPFILVIMSKGVIEKQADEIIPQIARMIYEFESE